MKTMNPIALTTALVWLGLIASCGGGGSGSVGGAGVVATSTPEISGTVSGTVNGGAGSSAGGTTTNNNTTVVSATCAPTIVANLAPILDSLGRPIDESRFEGGGGGGGDSGASGAGGAAGDGAPIANAPVTLTDNAGRTLRTTTDATGYYSFNIKCLTPPLLVKVTRADGSNWVSSSTEPIVARKFITMNITGLTDKVNNYVAEGANIPGGAAALTPALLAANASALPAAILKINTGLQSPLTFAGLNPNTFNPITSPYAAMKGDKYDSMLDRLALGKNTSGATLVVGTLAGVKEAYIDGPVATAAFNSVQAVAVDSDGNVFVADTQNHAIRKITPAGLVSTLAGGVESGFSNGVGKDARFAFPVGIAVDRSGNLFVTDSSSAIRKITPTGTVSTLAGDPVGPGFSNGVGTSARFFGASGLATDSIGNVYVADENNYAIRKITPAGLVTTLAGSGSPGFNNGLGAAASFSRPRGVAVDSSGNVFVADQNNSAIRKITSSGLVSTLAGSSSAGSGNGVSSTASFNQPRGVAVDSNGNVFVADQNNRVIRKITSAGLVSTLAGSGSAGFSNGIGSIASFSDPYGVAVDGNGNVLVADKNNNAIRKITPTGAVSTLAGIGSSGFTNGSGIITRFNTPSGVTVDSIGNVYVADKDNNAIRKITPTGLVSTLAGSGSAGFNNGIGSAATFNKPSSVAVDRTSNVFVADSGNHVIRKITPDGVVSTLAGSGSPGSRSGIGIAASFNQPRGVAVDIIGNVFVADSSNNLIRKITPAGVVSTLAGNGIEASVNGIGTAASFSSPISITVDSRGIAFVVDFTSGTVRKITSEGLVSNLDNTRALSFLSSFNAVAVDNSGNLFIASGLNRSILKVTPAGVESTLVGGGNGVSYLNGTSTVATFGDISAITVDLNGNLFVADTGNNAIRLVLP